MRIPDHKHRIVSRIGCHHPVLVLRAENRGDLIAVTLEKLLLLGDIVEDHTGMSSRVEDFGPLVVG